MKCLLPPTTEREPFPRNGTISSSNLKPQLHRKLLEFLEKCFHIRYWKKPALQCATNKSQAHQLFSMKIRINGSWLVQICLKQQITDCETRRKKDLIACIHEVVSVTSSYNWRVIFLKGIKCKLIMRTKYVNKRIP